jgi:hypothetical protein
MPEIAEVNVSQKRIIEKPGSGNGRVIYINESATGKGESA